MNIKKIAAAVMLGLASVAASAAPLASITGGLTVKLGGLTTETNTQAGTNESTWGVGFLDTVSSDSMLAKWTAGTDDGFLYYMIYGISDMGAIANATNGFDLYNKGATGGVADGKIHLDLYWSATQIGAIDAFKNAAPGDRTGYDSYLAFAGLGPAYLKLTFGQGIQTVDRGDTAWDDTLATLVQDVNGQVLPASGSGRFFLDVAGGTAASAWDTNTQAGHDMSGNFTLRPNLNASCDLTAITNGTCFAGLINDPILANKIPEPGSLALFGLGLAGLAGLRRRRAGK